MKVHISLNVNNIAKSAEFYARMFGTEPSKFIPASEDSVEGLVKRSGYAKFDISDPPLNLALNETGSGSKGSLSHLGLQVDTTDKVLEFKQRWTDAGLVTADEMDVTCCYAKQDKTWVSDPDGNEWEAFVVLENVEVMTEGVSGCCDGDFQGKAAEGIQIEKAEAGSLASESGCC